MSRQGIYSYRTSTMKPPKARRNFKWVVAAALLLLVVSGGLYIFSTGSSTPKAQMTTTKTPATAQSEATTPLTSTKSKPSPCATNNLSQLALVSVSQRHLWACVGTSVVYDSPVVTGMENLAADLTPTGTYHVYGKQSNLYLNGSDSTGSWHDYVYYWMPFLDNQYGAYGFHDATWRAPDAFGNISPYSSSASHGCVELPLATAKWLYNWVSIGTTVTIES